MEYQGSVEAVFATFDADSDGDGTSDGIEAAIGSDPDVSDPGHPNKLRFTGFDGSGKPQLSFGYVNSLIPLNLTRSTDLIDFSHIVATSGTDFTTASALLKLDPNPPSGPRLFYRLEARKP